MLHHLRREAITTTNNTHQQRTRQNTTPPPQIGRGAERGTQELFCRHQQWASPKDTARCKHEQQINSRSKRRWKPSWSKRSLLTHGRQPSWPSEASAQNSRRSADENHETFCYYSFRKDFRVCERDASEASCIWSHFSFPAWTRPG
jgi:hypothetical protein